MGSQKITTGKAGWERGLRRDHDQQKAFLIVGMPARWWEDHFFLFFFYPHPKWLGGREGRGPGRETPKMSDSQ